MQSNEPVFLPAQPKVDRRALTCVAIVGVASCVSTIVFGWLVWTLAPRLYPLIAAQVDKLTPTVLYVSSEGTGWTCDSWENPCGLQTALHAAGPGDEIWVKAGIYKPAGDTRSQNVV
ncbi:MAG TPA: hypothetical protein VFM05_01310, partial [Candidatus Saccharimonadales bacterium]|nr:hypothetical protein [Candidatus Saccharimonadales bacterium]